MTEPGELEGHICNRDGCTGVIEIVPVENCECHISPPCYAHTYQRTMCPVCEWMSEEE